MEERHGERDRERKKDKRETPPPNRRLRGRLCLHFILNDKIPNGFKIYILYIIYIFKLTYVLFI